METTLNQAKEILANSQWEVINNETKRKTFYSFVKDQFYINYELISLYDINSIQSNQFRIALIDFPGCIIRIAKITEKELIIIDHNDQFLAFHIIEQ